MEPFVRVIVSLTRFAFVKPSPAHSNGAGDTVAAGESQLYHYPSYLGMSQHTKSAQRMSVGTDHGTQRVAQQRIPPQHEI